MKTTYTLIFLLLISLNAFTQNIVKGKITDAQTNQPVPGASVVIKGEKKGVISDADGNFTLHIPAASKAIIVSSIGYADKEIMATSGDLNIVLTQTAKALNEVVVIGYGTKIKKDITGSVSQVNAKNITNTPVTSFETAMQGRAAGVFVQQQNGK